MKLTDIEMEELLDTVMADPYVRGAVWIHKDGGLYEIVNGGEAFAEAKMKEYLDTGTSITKYIPVVWYRKYHDDVLIGEVFVRTKAHFEKSFTHIPKVEITTSLNELDEI